MIVKKRFIRDMLSWCVALVLILVQCGSAAPATATSPNRPAIDWETVSDEAIGYLQDYLRIDTTNPPGNEEETAKFLERILRENGIPATLYGVDSGRANLVARLRGNGSKPPVILMSHADVVGVEESDWSIDPFGGGVREGFLWGRGTIDDKSLGIIHLMTVLLLVRHQVPLNRDVVFLVVADEETGGRLGTQWMLENHGDELRAEYVLGEGGYGTIGTLKNKAVQFACQTAEKGVNWLRLTTEGEAGHGSVPVSDNANVRMVRALSRLASYEPPFQLTPTVRLYLEKLSERMDYPQSYVWKNIASPEVRSVHRTLLESDIRLKGLLRNTINITGIKSGSNVNVVPSRCEATLDCRILPGDTPEEIVDEISRVINDPRVKIEFIHRGLASQSSPDTELFRIIELVTREKSPGSLTVPTLSTGGTDLRFFRERGVVAYGLNPCALSDEELRRIHGVDERLPLDGFKSGIEIFFEIIVRLCAG